MRGGGQCIDVEDRLRRLDHRPDAGFEVTLHVEQALADQFQRVDLADLRYQDAVRPGVGGGVEIIGVPRRLDAVDPDEHLAAAEAAGLHRVGDLLARLLLCLGRHRILEIEDHAVDRQGARLFDGAGVRSRHVEHAAARTKGHGSPS